MKNRTLSSLIKCIITGELNLPENMNREHIFTNYIAKISSNIEISTKLSIMYAFKCSQSSLKEARKGNLNLSLYWIEKSRNSLELLPFSFKSQSEALYFPAYAYVLYKQLKHNEAIECTKKSILLFNEIYENGLEEAYYASVEQKLNIFKIYLILDKTENASTIGVEILNDVFLNTKDQYRLQMIHHYVNMVFEFGLQYKKKDSNYIFEQIFNNIDIGLVERNPIIPEIQYAFDILTQKCTNEKLNYNTMKISASFGKFPKLLQERLLNYFMEHYELTKDLTVEINHYIDILKVPTAANNALTPTAANA